MATMVVSGRVDEDVKRRVDQVLEREGKTQGDVIRDVWVTISQTGRLPDTVTEEKIFKEKRRRFQEFLAFLESTPPAPDWFGTMTDEQMRDMIVEDMLAKEARYVQASH